MCSGDLLASGFVLLVFGAPSAMWPYQLARFEEQLDSIGSKRRWDDVEPADWKVTLTRGLGAVMAVGGGVLLLACLA